MSACERGQSRCAADAARPSGWSMPNNLSDTLAYWALTGTAVAVLPGARRLDRRVYCSDQAWVRARRAVGSQPMRTLTSAASPSRPRNRPSGSGVGCQVRGRGRCRHGRCASAVMRVGFGPEVWRGIRRLLLGRGGQAPAVSGTKSSSCLCGGCQATGPPRSPAPQRVSECAPDLGKAFPACRRACPVALRMPTRHPARVVEPGRH
jgi:hypothetical protein